MRVLDLFSGIGGFSLGLERAGMETVAFCEIEPFQRGVLKKHWPEVKCYEDVRELTADKLVRDGIGRIDVICGGFPCQDISVAGKRAGLEGESSGLWSHFARIICEIRPKYAILENTPSLCVRGLPEILGFFSDVGYDAEWEGIPAMSVGLPHLRARQWIVAYPSRVGDGVSKNCVFSGRSGAFDRFGRKSEPGVCRVDDGVPGRVDRVAALGNAVVPQIPEMIGRAIMATTTETASSPPPQS